MFTECKLPRSLVVVAAMALYSFATQGVLAHGGGGHGGGGHGGGGHRGGEHHGEEHRGEHNHHPFHPSRHHFDHHDGHHVAHNNHHHHDWHHGGWGPGYWGGAGLAYGGWGGWNGWYGGGNSVVDNVTNVTPVSNDSSGDNVADASNGNNDGDDEDNSNDGNEQGFATDNWPELGVATYSGEYGATQGQVIMNVIPGSAAEKAGLVSGDVILAFNGQPVPSADDLDTAMDAAHGKFDVSVWDARTGRKSNLSGALDPGIVAAPAATKAAALVPAK